MRKALRLTSAMAVMAVAVACGGGSSPTAPEVVPVDDPVFQLLEARQQSWCREITGRTCRVGVSAAYPEFAAWVDWDRHPLGILWNDRVLTDRQFWITDPLLAHEACHLKHGPQPGWTFEQKEESANRCAIEYTGSPS
jgi:hypothetical protein